MVLATNAHRTRKILEVGSVSGLPCAACTKGRRSRPHLRHRRSRCIRSLPWWSSSTQTDDDNALDARNSGSAPPFPLTLIATGRIEDVKAEVLAEAA